ncbi:hypothetical protein Tco_1433465 [Tanacetum coccineum]
MGKLAPVKKKSKQVGVKKGKQVSGESSVEKKKLKIVIKQKSTEKSKADKIVEAALDLEVENKFGEGGDLGYLGKDKDKFGTKLDPRSYKEILDVDSDVEST